MQIWHGKLRFIWKLNVCSQLRGEKKKKKKVCILITLSEETEVEPEGTKYSICGQLLVNSKSTEGSQ